jgi:hypothetical protein
LKIDDKLEIERVDKVFYWNEGKFSVVVNPHDVNPKDVLPFAISVHECYCK